MLNHIYKNQLLQIIDSLTHAPNMKGITDSPSRALISIINTMDVSDISGTGDRNLNQLIRKTVKLKPNSLNADDLREYRVVEDEWFDLITHNRDNNTYYSLPK